MDIGKLQRVPLREVWKHEAYDFTQWMEENIEVLNDALDLDLSNVERERAAGAFSIDLVAEDGSGGTVIIENQLEKSNHDHLGKLITYLTAMEAKTAIWIVSQPRPEHVAAINWLNSSSSAAFYLLKIEAVRIEDSVAAPLLTVIVGPSDDETIKLQKKEKNERQLLRTAWWTEVINHPEANQFSHLAPGYRPALGVTTGIRGVALRLVVKKDHCTAGLYIDRRKEGSQQNKSIFDQLKKHKDELEPKLSHEVFWSRLDERRASIVFMKIEGGYRSTEDDWPKIIDELLGAMNVFSSAIQPYLKKLKIDD